MLCLGDGELEGGGGRTAQGREMERLACQSVELSGQGVEKMGVQKLWMRIRYVVVQLLLLLEGLLSRRIVAFL